MPKWVHTNVFDNGLNVVKNTANEMLLITSYSPGDTYATVSARSVCSVNMAPADIVLGNFGTNERQLTIAAKTGTATTNSPATPDLAVALVDSTNGVVLAVADETSDQQITAGNPINFPQWNIRGRQPT